jgi:cytidylate kinase
VRFTVVTIARTLGARGDDIGSAVADELGFRYVDTEIIDRAAALSGATPEEIASAESRKSLLGRLVEHLGVRGGAPALSGHAGKHGYEDLIRDVIKETAAMDFVVIVAHGAGVALAGNANVLRVLVTAPKATRVQRTAQAQGLSESAAAAAVDESDAGRAEFLRHFCGLDHEDLTTYDLVINTDTLTVEEATRTVVGLVEG